MKTLAIAIFLATAAFGAVAIPPGDINPLPTGTILGRSAAGTGAASALTTLPSAVQDNITRLGAVTSGISIVLSNAASTGAGATTTLRVSGGTMTTAGDATRILFVNRNLSDDYGAAIQATSTGSAPGFLNPRLDFLVQPTNTNALSSLAIAASLTGNKNLLVGGTSDVTGPGAIVAFGTNEATTGGDAAIISSGGIYSTKKIITASSLTTGAPTTGTAAPWKVGVSVTTTALVLSTTVYLQVDISGTLYKVATIQ